MSDEQQVTSGAAAEDNFNSEQTLVLSGVLVTALVGAVAAYSVSDTPKFLWVCMLAVLQVGLFVASLRSTSSRTQKQLFWCEAIVILLLIYLVAASFIIILSVVWIVQSVELYGPRRSLGLLLASLVLFTAAQFMHYGLRNTLNILITSSMYGMLQLFALSVVQRFIGERRQKDEIATLNRELLATRQLLSQSAAQSERLRIARDLHDILGHHMTALILNLEIASHRIGSVEQSVSKGESTGYSEGKEKVEQALALAKLLLGDLRSTVSELRDDSMIDLESAIKQLIAGIPEFSFDLDFSAAPSVEDVDVAETVLRCAQEAITNVLRHSNGDRCRIAVRQQAQRIILTVVDNGHADKAITAGNGLNGMRERVSAQGGEMNWHQDQDGFTLEVALEIGEKP